MIIQIGNNATLEDRERLIQLLSARGVSYHEVSSRGIDSIVTGADVCLPESDLQTIGEGITVLDFDTDYQLCTRRFQPDNTEISLQSGLVFDSGHTALAVGPCAVETESQTLRTAEFLSEEFGLTLFRAGAFKPRTSPYSFQGLGEEGLRILERVRDDFGMTVITEVKDSTHLESVAEVADIIQVGTKAMYNPALLVGCGHLEKPICLKRGFMATVKEFLQAADFIMSSGNPNVILCERGIRSFEPQTRFCLDICGAALVQSISHLPLMLDPSHAMGHAAQVPAVARAAAGMGVESIMVEIHPDPSQALSDKSQALSFDEFRELYHQLKPICEATGRTIV